MILVLFLHIERTGGSTVNGWFGSTESFFKDKKNYFEISTGLKTIPNLSFQDKYPIYYISGHLSLTQAKAIIPFSIFEKVFIVTVVREPVQRVVSVYRLWLRSPDWFPDLINVSKNFPDYYAETRAWHSRNFMCRRIADTENAEAALIVLQSNSVIVGLTDNLGALGLRLTECLGDLIPEFKLNFQDKKSNEGIYLSDEALRLCGLDQNMHQMILDDNAEDLKLYTTLLKTVSEKKPAMNRKKNVIFLTDISPDLLGSGSQHLANVIECIRDYSTCKIIQITSTSNDYHRGPAAKINALALKSNEPIIHIELPILFENTDMDFANQLAYLHRIRKNSYDFFSAFDHEMVNYVKESIIIIFVQWPGMIFLWERFSLSNWQTVPILMDWYDPLFIGYPLSAPSKQLIRDSFNTATLHSSGLLVGSRTAAMSLNLQLCVPVREIMSIFRGSNANQIPDRNISSNKDVVQRTITIALAGQAYARDAIKIFLESINLLNSNYDISPHQYFLDYYGDVPIQTIQNMFTSYNVRFCGQFRYDELQNMMARFNLFGNLYGMVPYSFAPEFAHSAMFSFPSKLVAYVQAGVIPIYIGPRNSSVYELFKEYELCDLCLTSGNTLETATSLSKIVDSDEHTIRVKIKKLSKVFTPEYLQSCIHEVLDRV